MSLTTRVGLLAGASALTLTGASFADNPTGAQDQEARIAELEAQVAQLTGDNWLTEQRSEEIRGLVQDVLADADTRASLLQSGMTAGYDDGFMIGSPDGNFSLKINGQLQARYVLNQQDEDAGLDEDSYRWGFENTRTQLMFSGNVAGPEWNYYVQLDWGRDGNAELKDAWIGYDVGNGWQVVLGQMKTPLNREFLVASWNQLTVERSLVSYYNGGGRTQGIFLDWANDQWHFVGGYTDGTFGANSPWDDYDTEWSFVGRAEVLFSGTWQQFEDFTSPQGSETGMMLGGGVLYESDEFGLETGVEKATTLIATVDFSIEGDGWNAFVNYNYNDFRNGLDFAMNSIVVQGGFYLSETWEAFLRYEWTDFDDFGVDGLDIDKLNLLTFGVNGYYSSNVKMTTDFGYAFNAINAPTDTITGWRTDLGDQDGQWVLRSQLQLTF